MSFSQDWDMQSQAPPAKRETLLDSVERALYLKLTAQKRRYEILKGSEIPPGKEMPGEGGKEDL